MGNPIGDDATDLFPVRAKTDVDKSAALGSSTHRPSEGEVKLQGDGLGERECVLAEGLTRYVAEAA